MTCNECFHCFVCPFADGIEYANEEFIKLDCEHFINTANVAPIADTVRKMQERLKKELRSGNAIMDKSIADIIDQIAKEIINESAAA